jgi:hypothetical protein
MGIGDWFESKKPVLFTMEKDRGFWQEIVCGLNAEDFGPDLGNAVPVVYRQQFSVRPAV